MSRGLKRLKAGLLAVLACAFLLAACGGGDSDSTASTDGSGTGDTANSGATTKVEPAPTAKELEEITQTPKAPPREVVPSPEPTEKQTPQSEQKEKEAYERKRYGTPSEESEPFAKYSGEGAVPLHLAEYGDEQSAEERAEVGSALKAYLQATAAEEWDTACTYLAAGMKGQFETVAQQAKSSPKPNCGDILKAFVEKPTPGVVRFQVLGPEGVASLRIKEGGLAGEGAGFALFHGTNGKDYWMIVRREGGQWMINSMVPQPFER